MEGEKPGMITISLCMIVRNEEEALPGCLSSIKGIADEIVIVDTGSTDRTKEVARSFGAKVFDFGWINDFAAARNYSFRQATQEYILWLDADDRIAERDRRILLELKENLPPDTDSVTMPYNLAFDSDGNVTASLRRNRLVRRDRGFRWIGAVHEYLEVRGRVINSEAAVTHSKNKAHTDRNLQIYRTMLQKGKPFTPRDMYYYANELRDHGIYEEAAAQYERFLATKQGWIEDNLQACLKLAECRRRMGDRTGEIQALSRYMAYSPPRPELCCRMGDYWRELENYKAAIVWYELALKVPEPADSMGLRNQAYSTWLPHLQLCVCWDRLGEHQKAFEHNETALGFAPSHPSMLYNRTYFQRLLSIDEEEASANTANLS